MYPQATDNSWGKTGIINQEQWDMLIIPGLRLRQDKRIMSLSPGWAIQ
jgi:hypothetical protein